MDKGVSAVLSGGAVLAAATLGARNGPQRPITGLWYGLLRKPEYTPPGPFIGAAWGVLELLLVGTGYRLLRAPGTTARGIAVSGWSLTLLGLAGHPWLFFGRKRLGSSTVVAGTMLASATATAVAGREVDKPAAAMTVPLVLWLAFATVLSEELWRKNTLLSAD